MFAAGAKVPGVLGPLAAPGTFGANDAGGVVPGASLALGLIAPGTGPVAPGGTGGAPFMPGTGSALDFGSASGARFAGNGLAGGAPGLIAGLIEALGGTGSFPCWMSVALCATEGGRAGVAAAGVVSPNPGRPLAAPA